MRPSPNYFGHLLFLSLTISPILYSFRRPPVGSLYYTVVVFNFCLSHDDPELPSSGLCNLYLKIFSIAIHGAALKQSHKKIHGAALKQSHKKN